MTETADQYDDDDLDEMDWQLRQDRMEDMEPCGCKFCFCFTRTKYGETCYDCMNHAHQG